MEKRKNQMKKKVISIMKQFFTFEGIDGSGKSTIIRCVASELKKKDYHVIITFEPTNTWLGEYVQQQIRTHSDPYVTSFAFIADRIRHCKIIQEWLDQGFIVLCDRYAESTYAYQAVQLERTLNQPIKWLKDLSKNRILIPDRTYYFNISIDDALSRIQHRDELIPFEQRVFLEKVSMNYETVCRGKRFFHLDATKSIDELTKICIDDILVP